MADKHLFFDLDRTLWDFETNSKKALEFLFSEFQLADSIQNFYSFHGTYKRINASLWKLYGKGKMTKEELRDERFIQTLSSFNIHDRTLAVKFSDSYVEFSPKQTILFPNTLETLEELKKLNYQMHIITNGFEEVQHIKLDNSNLKPFFDVIVCSENVGCNKPDIRVFQYAMNKAKAKASESIMIGDDREVDILGAMRSGMRAILFDPENHHKQASDDLKIRNINELPLLLAMMK